jgi:hypothetical protein
MTKDSCYDRDGKQKIGVTGDNVDKHGHHQDKYPVFFRKSGGVIFASVGDNH